MKKILLLAVLAVVLIGCGSGDEDYPVLEYVFWTGESPFDETLSASLGDNITLYKDGVKVHERKLYPPEKEVIETGYGESIELGYHSPKCVIFLKNSLVIEWTRENLSFDAKSKISFYTNSLDSITTISAEDISGHPSTYGDDKIAVGVVNDNPTVTYKIMIYSGSGKLLYEKAINNKMYFPPLYGNIPLSNDVFINIGDDVVAKGNFEDILWSNAYVDCIDNEPEGETKPPKAELKNYQLQSNILIITLDVTYFSGQKEVVEIKINIDTGERVV